MFPVSFAISTTVYLLRHNQCLCVALWLPCVTLGLICQCLQSTGNGDLELVVALILLSLMLEMEFYKKKESININNRKAWLLL